MALFMDQELARRLERVEGTVGASFVAVRRSVTPEAGAIWRDHAGTYAIFDGPDSPMTQTFGLGLWGAVSTDQLATIETFFRERGAATMHEVSPLAGVELVATLVERGYRPMEFSTVLVQPTAEARAPIAPTGLRAREAEPADRDAWVATSATGWSDDPVVAAAIRSFTDIAFANAAMTHFVAELDGAPIATGSVGIHEGVALLAGASTVPSGRGRGAQNLLLGTRLAEARRRGCTIAMMVTAPGSTSQRNAERNGFHVAYTRTKWRLTP